MYAVAAPCKHGGGSGERYAMSHFSSSLNLKSSVTAFSVLACVYCLLCYGLRLQNYDFTLNLNIRLSYENSHLR
jgi:hypothetical protein